VNTMLESASVDSQKHPRRTSIFVSIIECVHRDDLLESNATHWTGENTTLHIHICFYKQATTTITCGGSNALQPLFTFPLFLTDTVVN